MSERLLLWTAIQIGRRKFIARTLAAAFGIVAGLSAGRLEALAGCPCSGPWGSGYCGYDFCNPYTCGSAGGWSCTFLSGKCPGGSACWTCTGYGCCDCICNQDSYPENYFVCVCAYSF